MSQQSVKPTNGAALASCLIYAWALPAHPYKM